MKHLITYNESKEDNPLDPTSDVEEFKAMFPKKWKTVGKSLDKILNHHPTQTTIYDIYEVYTSDDYGRKEKLLGYFKGISRSHAKIRASIITKSYEIYTTGFYGAEIITPEKIESEITKLKNKISALENPL